MLELGTRIAAVGFAVLALCGIFGLMLSSYPLWAKGMVAGLVLMLTAVFVVLLDAD